MGNKGTVCEVGRGWWGSGRGGGVEILFSGLASTQALSSIDAPLGIGCLPGFEEGAEGLSERQEGDSK